MDLRSHKVFVGEGGVRPAARRYTAFVHRTKGTSMNDQLDPAARRAPSTDSAEDSLSLGVFSTAEDSSALETFSSLEAPSALQIASHPAEHPSFDQFVATIAALRAPDGCPWDKEQTHETLTPYVVEEAYEVVSAIKKKDCDNLCEELGDLLLQVVLHAQIAEEKNEFNIHDVINSVNQKMVRRHPHVFANSGLPEDLYKNWDEIKKDEHKYCTITEEMKVVAEALPALTYAEKIQKKAAKVHFDFKNADEALKKLSEECAELKAAMDKGNNESIFEECGDVLFSAVNVMRLLKQSPEDALRNSIAKFMNRFETVENEVLAKGENIAEKTEQELDELWIRAKAKQ